MRRFNKAVFISSLSVLIAIAGIAIGISISTRSTPIILTPVGVSVIVTIALAGSLLASILIASYAYFTLAVQSVYRPVIRYIAKKAIRASLSHAVTQLPCLGILDRNGTVAIRLRIETNWTFIGKQFRVYDAVNHELWGRVEIVEIGHETFLCQPFDRVNPIFWERLEDRMSFDTSPPNVYLIQEIPTQLLEAVERLLDDWR